MSDNITIVNTDGMSAPEVGKGLWANRACVYDNMHEKDAPLVSILVQGYNRLDKTKYCVECVLKYTKDVDYELILVDNGSSDGTFEFFKSVDYPRKKVFRITTNVGMSFTFDLVRKNYKGKYLVTVANDVYVTPNWLSNMLACFNSNPRIGMVVPMCSNASNFQTPPEMEYTSMEEMQEKAAKFNFPDSSKWQERMRLITLAPVYKREIFDTVGSGDNGYEHNFSDDDISVRVRRAGYKLIVCGDTFVCHDHTYVMSSPEEAEEFNRALEEDRKSFREKFHGIDAWDDINNFEKNLLGNLNPLKYIQNQEINILGMDVRCGTPIMEMRNILRHAKIKGMVHSYAYTTQAKYYEDLLTAADEIYCDRIDFIQDYIPNNFMDVILLGEPINNYYNPVRLLQKLFDLLNRNGTLLFKAKNTDDFPSFLRMVGVNALSDGEMSIQILPEEIADCLKVFGAKDIKCIREMDKLSEQNLKLLNQASAFDENSPQFKAILDKVQTKQYLFYVEK